MASSWNTINSQALTEEEEEDKENEEKDVEECEKPKRDVSRRHSAAFKIESKTILFFLE